jgi:hypothetical protein
MPATHVPTRLSDLFLTSLGTNEAAHTRDCIAVQTPTGVEHGKLLAASIDDRSSWSHTLLLSIKYIHIQKWRALVRGAGSCSCGRTMQSEPDERSRVLVRARPLRGSSAPFPFSLPPLVRRRASGQRCCRAPQAASACRRCAMVFLTENTCFFGQKSASMDPARLFRVYSMPYAQVQPPVPAVGALVIEQGRVELSLKIIKLVARSSLYCSYISPMGVGFLWYMGGVRVF